MRKHVAMFCVLGLLLTLVSGCSIFGQPSVTGTELAKLLLANERLNAEDFSKTSVMFTPLSQAISGDDNGGIRPLSLPVSALRPLAYGSDDLYSEANMMSFFDSYIRGIDGTIERALSSITAMKEKIGLTDVWVEGVSGSSGDMLLHVEAGSELLVEDNEAHVFVCRRHADDNANDVYEIAQFEKADSSIYRMKYIPDQYYEYAIVFDGGDRMVVVADKSRGYWNMTTFYSVEDNYNVQNLSMTGNTSFVGFGHYGSGGYEFDAINFMNADRTADLFSLNGDTVSIQVAAFDGVGSAEVDQSRHVTSFTTVSGETFYAHAEEPMLDAMFFNGGVVNEVNGESGEKLGDTATLTFVPLSGDAPRDRAANVFATLNTLGITCGAAQSVLADVNGAWAVAEKFPTYFTWEGVLLSDKAAVDRAFAKNDELFAEMKALYDGVKDAKKVGYTALGMSFRDLPFAKVDTLRADSITLNEGRVQVKDLTLTVSGLQTLEADGKYTVRLALAKLTTEAADKNVRMLDYQGAKILGVRPLGGTVEADYTGAVLLETEDPSVLTTFTAGETFTASQTAAFSFPTGTNEGAYTVAAYVATEDGIRVSEMVPIPFSEEVDVQTAVGGGLYADLFLNDHRELIARFASGDYAVLPKTPREEYTYAQLKEELLAVVCTVGFPVGDMAIERVSDSGHGIPLGADEVLTEGLCRMKYKVWLDNSEQYVYLNLNSAQ